MALQRLNKTSSPITLSKPKVIPPKKAEKRPFMKPFGKILTISAWLFSIVVLLNLEPVTRVSDTLISLDSFLRYIRSEDKEFEKNIDHKYTKLQKSIETVKISSLKSLNFLKEKLDVPLKAIQSIFDEGCQLLEKLGKLLQTYLPPQEVTNTERET